MISKDKVRIAISIDKKLLHEFKNLMDPSDSFTYSEMFKYVLLIYIDFCKDGIWNDKETK